MQRHPAATIRQTPPGNTTDTFSALSRIRRSRLTRNLFTFFGTPLKFDKHEGNVSAIQPTSRPCTSVSRKGAKFSGNVNNKLNDGHPSIKKTSLTDMKRVDENNPCKQVTLFPIVTSLTTDKERNITSAKRGFLNTFASGKKR
ncbi:hypothetical protein AVEN_153039-1 [Araneus ventricosus]|uniref:Uncharacterized protein n=1 Tax=Araneus ventricosus TaxID=182803 RepID=A0A4Y2JBL2_ARAVE|nr:hypothetical protein AVEN_153039-1 [Araneus ventricosus]